MVAYNFQSNFAPDILAGRKTSTIRPNGKRAHAKAGDQVQLFTGLRTDECVRLLNAPCLRSRPIEIWPECIKVDGVWRTNPVFYDVLAHSEGFTSYGNMQAWFDHRYGLPARDLTQIEWDFSRAECVAQSVAKGGS